MSHPGSAFFRSSRLKQGASTYRLITRGFHQGTSGFHQHGNDQHHQTKTTKPSPARKETAKEDHQGKESHHHGSTTKRTTSMPKEGHLLEDQGHCQQRPPRGPATQHHQHHQGSTTKEDHQGKNCANKGKNTELIHNGYYFPSVPGSYDL